MPVSSDNPTITAIFPTRNTSRELARHGQEALDWLDCVGQVVIVDSSDQGAVDALHQSWPDHVVPEVHIRPPGLYAAWNFGAEQARGEYCYYSTVGDATSREGLLHLQQTAVELSADVVISPPDLRDGGEPAAASWPIHHFVRELASPRLLSNDEKILWFAGLLPQSLLGSSAANLYATSLLQKHPFPIDCGHAGDVAWACSWPEGTRVAVTPQVCSRFTLHAPRQPVGAEEHATITLELQKKARHLAGNTDPATASSRAFLLALFSLEQSRLAWLEALGREQKTAPDLLARITELEKALAECHRKSGLFGWLRR
jgi:hypothetical protein